MAAPQTEVETGKGPQEAERKPVQTFKTPDPSPEPGPLDEPPEQPGDRQRPTTLLTVLAVLGAIGLGTSVVVLANSVTPDTLPTWNIVLLSSLASLIALVGLLPMRWGWYVMAATTVAFYGITIYNLLQPENTLFQFVSAEAPGTAILGSGTGVVVGAVAQFLYRWVGGD